MSGGWAGRRPGVARADALLPGVAGEVAPVGRGWGAVVPRMCLPGVKVRLTLVCQSFLPGQMGELQH